MGGAGMTVLEDAAAALRDFRKSGKKVIAAGRRLRHARLLPRRAGRRGPPQPGRHGPDRGLRPLPDLLPRWDRQARHHLERLPRRRVQVGRRALPAERHVARGEGGRPRVAGRPLARLPRRRRHGAQDDARSAHRPRRGVPGAAEGRRRRPREGRPRREAGRQARRPRRGAQADDRLAGEDEKSKSFKQVSMADYLEALGDDRPGAKGKGDKVAVVVAKGDDRRRLGRPGPRSAATRPPRSSGRPARTRRSRRSSSASTAAAAAPSPPR